MPSFAYQAQNERGRTESGRIQAADAAEASSKLTAKGWQVLDVRQEYADADDDGPVKLEKKVKRTDVIGFASQLAVMVDTGVPITEALDSIAEQTEHPGLADLVGDLSERVKGGTEFSAALAVYPKIFDELFVALMRASEASGTMGTMLMRASAYMQKEQETRRRVKGAMIYPACMLAFCTLVVVGLMVFILPRFKSIYEGKGAVLPAPTRILMAVSDGMTAYWPLLLGGLVAVIGGAWAYFRTPGGKRTLDNVRISAPILGNMYRKASLARSLRTFATLIQSGVGMLDGLAITAQASGNCVYSEMWSELSQSLREGESLSDCLSEYELVPGTITQMISAGERTGRLGEVTERVASYVEEELQVTIKAITQMIEPAMIIIMGGLVGGIAMALLLPVFSASRMMAN